MNRQFFTILTICLLLSAAGSAQQRRPRVFTKADTLRGSITSERAWWDVQRYDITVRPDYLNKTITGQNNIQYKVVSGQNNQKMQIDLKEPLIIDSILLNAKNKIAFEKEGSVW